MCTEKLKPMNFHIICCIILLGKYLFQLHFCYGIEIICVRKASISQNLESSERWAFGHAGGDHLDYIDWGRKTWPWWATPIPGWHLGLYKWWKGTTPPSLFPDCRYEPISCCVDFLAAEDCTLNCNLKSPLSPLSCLCQSIYYSSSKRS